MQYAHADHRATQFVLHRVMSRHVWVFLPASSPFERGVCSQARVCLYGCCGLTALMCLVRGGHQPVRVPGAELPPLLQ